MRDSVSLQSLTKRCSFLGPLRAHNLQLLGGGGSHHGHHRRDQQLQWAPRSNKLETNVLLVFQLSKQINTPPLHTVFLA